MRYTERLGDIDAVASVGSRGDSFDNALAETTIGLVRTELIHRHRWRSAADAEFALLTYVEWFNTRRLLSPPDRWHPTRRVRSRPLR